VFFEKYFTFLNSFCIKKRSSTYGHSSPVTPSSGLAVLAPPMQ